MDERGVCAPCWGKIRFIHKPFCKKCSCPFAFDVPCREICEACLQKKLFYEESVCVFVYDGFSKNLILRFKNGGDLSLVPLFGRWLFYWAQPLLPSVDVIVPVPLHWTRLWKRHFNQSGLLAKELSKLSLIPYHPTLLRRVKKTPSQGPLTKIQRQDNVHNAFFIHKKHQETIYNKRILLVDDVYTTGATLNACAKTLVGKGASCVKTLTLARVLW